jgi:uncharacterized damage-inducible protein DinB
MSEIANIVDEAKRAYEGNAWHGPALTELLSDVSADQAAATPVPAAHSIWEIVLHIAGWQSVASHRLKGEAVAEPREGDWPPVNDKGAESWEKALARLDSAQEELMRQISRLPESALQQTAAGTDYSVYFMLHGVIQHTLYHAGQIALLKKA